MVLYTSRVPLPKPDFGNLSPPTAHISVVLLDMETRPIICPMIFFSPFLTTQFLRAIVCIPQRNPKLPQGFNLLLSIQTD